MTTSASAPKTYTVNFTANATNSDLAVEDDFVLFDLNGHSYTTITVISVEIGNVVGKSAGLRVTDGSWNFGVNTNSIIEIGGSRGKAPHGT